MKVNKIAYAKSHTHCQVAQKAISTSQNLSKSMSLPTHLAERENNEMATMAKKHRGFGGELKIQNFD